MQGRAAVDFERLSRRHRECLRLVYVRRTSKEIGRQLGIEASTVDGYMTEATAILRARNRRDAAELLHAHELENAPCKLIPQSSGVDWRAKLGAASTPSLIATWFAQGTFRQQGAATNGLRRSYRAGWIVHLAASCEIGFAAILIALHALKGLLGAS